MQHEHFESEAIEKDIINLENKYWEALKANDVQTMMDLSDEICTVAGPQGVMKFDKDEFHTMMKEPNYKIMNYKIDDDYKVTVLNPNTAVIAYKVHEELTVDGKPVTLEASDSSTWVRREGKWVCSLHTEAILGDPFGRDKMHERI